MSVFEPSPARRGLDLLLATHPHLDVVRVASPTDTPEASPWLLVDLGQRSADGSDAYAVWRFAVWRSTGAVHGIDHDGAVSDDPILTLEAPQ